MKFNRDYRSILKRGAWIRSQNVESERVFNAWLVIGSIIMCLAMLIPSCAHAEHVDMSIISIIESNDNEMAYNSSTQARGLYQITPVCLADYNQLHHYPKSEESLFDEAESFLVANWYMNKRIPKLLEHYNYDDTIDNRLIAYNCGIKCMGKKLPIETQRYISKYHNIKNSLK